MELREFVAANGVSPFADWFDRLDPQAAAKVTVALIRLELGNLSNVKGVGSGIFEYRIGFGPGYRLYFGKDGDKLIILLAGGTKKRQQRDIEVAHIRWAEYKRRKKGGG